jgi:predicted anti-sigma-YlaC factor YlaD
MNRPDHSTFREWLNLDADGMLGGEERARLNEHVASCGECRQEREELLALGRLLQATMVAPRPEFRNAVMAALPHAGWEGRSPRTWSLPVAMMVMLMVGATLLVSGSAPVPALSTLAAVGGMLRAAALAGAGLLGASWKGIGLVVDEVLSSPVSLAAVGFLVVCLNLLLVSLVRRRRPSAVEARRGR